MNVLPNTFSIRECQTENSLKIYAVFLYHIKHFEIF